MDLGLRITSLSGQTDFELQTGPVSYGQTGYVHRRRTPPAGYRLVGGDGGVFSFRRLGVLRLDGEPGIGPKPVVGMATTPTGHGLLASGIRRAGCSASATPPSAVSTGNLALAKPVVGMATTPYRPRLLASGIRRRGVQLRRRGVSTVRRGTWHWPNRSSEWQPLSDRPRLLASGIRRRGVQLRATPPSTARRGKHLPWRKPVIGIASYLERPGLLG